MSHKFPVARKGGLLIQSMNEETLIYDTAQNEARLLNQTAGAIWKMCDGKTTVSQMSRRLNSELGVSLPEDVVRYGLAQLDEYALLQSSPGTTRQAVPVTRRKLLKLGIAISLVPLVTSIVAPTVNAAVSNGAPP